MAPKQPPSQEDAQVTLTLCILYAAGDMFGDDGKETRAMATVLWPKSIHKDALHYGSGAINTIAAAFGISADQLADLAKHMFANT